MIKRQRRVRRGPGGEDPFGSGSQGIRSLSVRTVDSTGALYSKSVLSILEEIKILSWYGL